MNDVEQLALFMQKRDAMIFGFNDAAGVLHPTWAETETNQQDYLNDARAFLQAVVVLGYRKVEGK